MSVKGLASSSLRRKNYDPPTQEPRGGESDTLVADRGSQAAVWSDKGRYALLWQQAPRHLPEMLENPRREELNVADESRENPMTTEPRREGRDAGTATIDASGRFRYRLTRNWSASVSDMLGGHVCWIMLNPSTADAAQDDPTIRRCIAFSKAWGFGGLVVVNLFALRATDPRHLRLPRNHSQSDYLDVVGERNDEVLESETDSAAQVIAAWGNHGALYERCERALEIVGPLRLYHLGLTKQGQPRHPLYVKGDVKPELWP